MQGLTVKIGSSTLTRPTGTTITNSSYVRVRGTVGTDGSISADEIQIRTNDIETDWAKVKLIGVITDYVDNTQFMVRGVPVDASDIDFSRACPNVNPANDVLVEVHAQQQPSTNVVKASKVICKLNHTLPVLRRVKGTVSSVDAMNKTFTLRSQDNQLRTVQWNEKTRFIRGDANSLNGKNVRIDGFIKNGIVDARVVIFDQSNGSEIILDDDSFNTLQNGENGTGWDDYSEHKRMLCDQRKILRCPAPDPNP